VPVVVPSGEEAIEEAERECPDLVLMDIMLEGALDGISAAAQIWNCFNIPVIYLTAYADDDTLRRASITEPHGYLLKPFEERELHTTIEMALYKHRAEEALRRRDAILSAVSFAAEQFLKDASWEKNIEPVLKQYGQAAKVSRAYVLRIDVAEDGVRLTGQGYEWTAPGTKPRLEGPDLGFPFRAGGSSRWQETLSQNQPIYGHVREFLESEREILMAQDIRSTVVVPIFVEQAWWGFMGLDECLQEREWSIAEVDALRTAASILGAAIQRTRLHQEVERRATEMSTLYEMSTAGMTSIRLDEILSRTVAALHRMSRADGITVLLARPGVDGLVVYPAADLPSGPRLMRAPVGASIAGWVMQTGKPVLLDHVEGDKCFQALDPHTASALCVPLRTGQRIIGALNLESHQPAAFGESDLRLLSILAGHLAAVIENAHLVEGLELAVVARTAEIIAEKERSETVLRSVGDAICMTDGETRVRYVNPSFTSLTGYTAQEITGQPVNCLLAETCPQPDRHSWQRTLTKGERWQGELVLQRKDGRTYEAAMTLAPMRDAEGHLTGYVSSHQDISQRRRLDRARSQFMANVSHELRTPASQMKLCTRLLRQRCRPEETGSYLRVMEDQVDRLLHLIQDVLLMAELDSGEAIGDWKPISVSRLIRDTVGRYQSQANEAKVTLEARPVLPDLPVVNGDWVRLTQALGELVENAVIFTPSGGQVTVEAGTVDREEQRWVTVAVHDTGPGISLEEQGYIFDRLYRGSLAESGHLPGTGLGLSMAQEILRAHGGRVTVESRQGEGSTFALWLRGGS
jgi:PAS domain S-box-containing protein